MKIFYLLSILLVITSLCGFAQVKPSGVFGDNMVLQRHLEVPVWGTAEVGESIMVSINGITVETKADLKGEWKVKLPEFEAGGPYELKVSGPNNSVVFKNVMLGEVWFASGQSNIEYTMERGIPNGAHEIAAANYNNIRLFHHPKTPRQFPVKTIGGGCWQTCTPENIRSFSAVAYFFAREIHKKYDVPVGIILSGWGGTRAESWCSYDVLKTIDEYKEEALKLERGEIDWMSDYEPMKVRKERNKKILSRSFNAIDQGVLKTEYDDEGWEEINFSKWNKTTKNVTWIRKEFNVSASDVEKDLVLNIGRPYSRMNIYLNGEPIHKSIGKEIKHALPSNSLLIGENTLVVRIADSKLNPRFESKKKAQLATPSGDIVVDLSGIWKYNNSLEPEVKPYIKHSHINGSMFGGMVNPFVGYGIKGVIWYQGEANTTTPYLYCEVFPKMIQDWRLKWEQGDFPFLYVQLPNYIDPKVKKGMFSSWPLLRESQMKTLEIPNTGMAIAIDLGDSTDIHPQNKYPVGLRLSKIARRIAYGEDIVYTGPMFKSFKVKKNMAVVSFDHTGSGFITPKGNEIKGFEIAGKDKEYHSAKAIIQGGKIIVSNKKVKTPVAVRYNWDDNPIGNLYNSEGFAAAPFRTDNWRY